MDKAIKVKELILLLQECDPEKEIYVTLTNDFFNVTEPVVNVCDHIKGDFVSLLIGNEKSK